MSRFIHITAPPGRTQTPNVSANQYIATRETLQGPKMGPFPVRTVLGWTVTGPLGVRTSSSTFETNFTAHHIQENDVLFQMIQRVWLAESVDTESTTPCKNTTANKPALKFLEENMRQTGESSKLHRHGKTTLSLKTTMQ